MRHTGWHGKINHKYHWEMSYLDVSKTQFIHTFLKLHTLEWTTQSLVLGIFNNHVYKKCIPSLYRLVSRGTCFPFLSIIRFTHNVNSSPKQYGWITCWSVPYLVFSQSFILEGIFLMHNKLWFLDENITSLAAFKGFFCICWTRVYPRGHIPKQLMRCGPLPGSLMFTVFVFYY